MMPNIGGHSNPKSDARRRTVGEVDGFITLLRAACDDRTVSDALEKLLSLPDDRRRALVHTWVSDLLVKNAPKDFIEAIAWLLDDAIAEKAYEVIFQCRR
jgi:hypothetical protein